MKKLLAGLLGSMALIGVASQAGAAVVTTGVQSIYFGTHLTEFDSSNPAQGYATQAFSLFDTNLGTLLSVSVRATYQENSNLTLTNTGATTAKGTANSKSDLYLNASDSGQDAVISSLLNPSGNAVTALGGTVSYTGTNGIAAGSSRSFVSNSPVSDTNYQTDSLAQDIAYFAAAGGGAGSVIANTATYTSTTYTGGNLQSSQTTQGTPTFYIYYTYDNATAAVPEPGTWLMMILGFGAIGLGLRRRGSNLVLG